VVSIDWRTHESVKDLAKEGLLKVSGNPNVVEVVQVFERNLTENHERNCLQVFEDFARLCIRVILSEVSPEILIKQEKVFF
jgi:hypothetical protein